MGRRLLNMVYQVTEALAALLVFAIFAAILTQVLLAMLGRTLNLAGIEAPTLAIPSYAEIATYVLVSAAFLALAGTLRAGVHVRVTLFVEMVPAAPARVMEAAIGLIGLLTSTFFGWRVAVLVHESWIYGDTSYGQLAIPLWLPQGTMLIGLIVLTIAFADLIWTGLSRPVQG